MTRAMDVLQDIRRTGRPEGTSLHEGIFRSLQLVTTAQFPRRAVIIISDGMDTKDTVSQKDVEKAIRRTSALIYSLVPDTRTVVSGDNPVMKRVEVTGGRKFTIANDKDWTKAVDSVTADFEHYYVLSVRLPADAPDDKWHEIKVTLADSTTTHTVRSRTGYMRLPPNVGRK